MNLSVYTSLFAKGSYSLQVEQLFPLQQLDVRVVYYLLIASLLASITLLLIFILYIRRIAISARDTRADNLKFKYQYLIYEALVESQAENGANAQQLIVEKLKKEVAKGKLHKQILVDLVIDLKKNFSGDSEKQLVQLYQSLHLFEYSLQKLDSRRWDVQAKGIRELMEMDYAPLDTQLIVDKLRFASNVTVAQEAQIALIKLEKHPLAFLNDLENPLTDWQQISIHHLLSKIDRKFIPDFTTCLSSTNESVVKFVLRMIAEFDQKQAEFKVMECLYHPSIAIKEEAILTLIKLEAKNALPQIIEACQDCHISSYLDVIKAVHDWDETAHIAHIVPLAEHPCLEIQQAVQFTIKKLTQTAREKGTSIKSAYNNN